MSEEERDELIFICSMMSNYGEDYLKSLSDKELIEIYNKSMNTGLEV